MKSIFIYNPESGRGKLKKHINYIISELSKKYGEIEVVETTHAGHASEIALFCAKNKYDYFFLSGGDGTLNEVINGFGNEEHKPTIGYIPSGTINDVARSLGISKNIKKAVKTIVQGETFAHDIFKANDKFGIYVCCTGIFTSTSYSASRTSKKALGKIAYFLKGVKDVFTAKPVHVELLTQDEKINRNCAMVLILNSKSAAGFKINQNALLDDGEVEIVLIHSHENKVKLSEIIKTCLVFFRGVDKYKNSKKITYRKLSKFTLKTEQGTIINLDGEKSGKGSFDFQVIKKAINIIVQKK